MTDEQLIAKFMELQEHPEQMTDQQLLQALDDEQMQGLVEQMAFAKRTFKHEDVQTNMPSVEDEWAKFAAIHPEKRQAKGKIYKIAASFVGVLLASGIAIAAINLARNESTPVKTMQTLPTTADKAAAPLASDTVATEPRIFNNVTLEKMLTEIVAAHHTTVEFQNKEARQLRFHFVWKHEDSLSRTVEKLNTFESVNIVIENEKLIVR